MTQWKVSNPQRLIGTLELRNIAHEQPPLTPSCQQSKLNLGSSSQLGDKSVGTSLKLGLFSYPVLQAADILVHRYVIYII
jgi:tryptophanyl-tRNA synthetase